MTNLQGSNDVKDFAVATLLTGAAWEFNDTLRFMERPFKDTDAYPQCGYFRVLWFFLLLDKKLRKEMQSLSPGSKICELMMEPLEAEGCAGCIGVRLWLLIFKEIDESVLEEIVEKTLTDEPTNMSSHGETADSMRANFFGLFSKSKKRTVVTVRGGGGGGGKKKKRGEQEEEGQPQDDEQQPVATASIELDTEDRISHPVSLHFRFMKLIANPYTNNHFINASVNDGLYLKHHMLNDVFDRRWAFRDSFRGVISNEQMSESNYFTIGDDGKTILLPDKRLTNELYDNFAISEDCLPSNFGPNSPNPSYLFSIFRPILPKRIWDGHSKSVIIKKDYWKRPLLSTSRVVPPGIDDRDGEEEEEEEDFGGQPMNGGVSRSILTELDQLNRKVEEQCAQLLQVVTNNADRTMEYIDWLRHENESIGLRHHIDIFMQRRLESGSSKEKCKLFIKRHGMAYFFDMLSNSHKLPSPLVEQVKWWKREYSDMKLVNQHMKMMHMRLRTSNLSYFSEFIVSMNTIWHRIGDLRKNFKETWMLYFAVDGSVFYLAPYSSSGLDEGIRGWIVFISPFGSGKTHFQDFIKSISLNGAVDKTTYNSRLAGTGGAEGPGITFDQTAVVKIWDEASAVIDPPKGDKFATDFLKNVATSAEQKFKHMYIDPETKERVTKVQNARIGWIAVMNMNGVPLGLTENAPLSSRIWKVHMPKQTDQVKHNVPAELSNNMRKYLKLFSWFTTICIHMINSGVLNDIDTTMFKNTIEFFNMKNPNMAIEERRCQMLLTSVLSMTVKYAVWVHIFCRNREILSLRDAFEGIDEYLIVTRECVLWILSLYSKELYITETPEPLKNLFCWPPPLKGMKCTFRNSNSGSMFDYGDLIDKQVDRLVIKFDTKPGMLNSIANAINRQSKNGQYNGDMVQSFIDRQSQEMIEEKGYVLSQENVIRVPAYVSEENSVMFIEPAEYSKLSTITDSSAVVVLKLHLLIKVADKYIHGYNKFKLWVKREGTPVKPNLVTISADSSNLEFTGDQREFKITPVGVTNVDDYCLFMIKYHRPLTPDGKPVVPRGTTQGQFQDSQIPLGIIFKGNDGTDYGLNTNVEMADAHLSNIPSTFIEDSTYKKSFQQSMYITPGGPGKPWELSISMTWMKETHEKRSFENVLKDTFSTSTTPRDTLLLSGKYVNGSAYIFDTMSLTNNPLNTESYSNLNFFDANEGVYDMDYVGSSKQFTKDPMEELFKQKISKKAYEMLTSEQKRRISEQGHLDKLEDILKLSRPNVKTNEFKYPDIVMQKKK